jgi:hypothetical protein
MMRQLDRRLVVVDETTPVRQADETTVPTAPAIANGGPQQ